MNYFLKLRMRSIFSSLTLFFLLFGCNSSGENELANINGPGTTTTSLSPSSMSGFGSLSAALKMSSGSGSVAASSAQLKIASYPQYNKTANSSGQIVLNNMPPGTYTIYTTAELPATAADAGDIIRSGTTPRAAQFKDIVISADSVTTLSSSTVLTAPGSISGTIELINNPNNVTLEGILVYIPGTSYSAYSDSSGNFSMSEVPAGTYDYLKFQKDGLTESQLEDIVVASGTNTALASTVRMSLSTGPSGEITSIANSSSVTISGSAKAVLQSNSVTLNLKYDTRAVLMKVAHESAFLNVNWVPVTSTYTFTSSNNSSAYSNYSTDGTKNVYVKFADANGLESSVYTKEFIIDNDSPTLSSITLLNGWGYVANTDQGSGVYATQKIPVTFSASDAGTGVKEMMLCNNSAFTGCSWETYATTRSNWDLNDNSTGTKTVYAKVRDYVDRDSSSSSNTIIVTSFTLLPNTNDASMTLSKENGPYTWDSDILFSDDLTIEAGTTLYYTATSQDFQVNGKLTINGTSGSPVTLRPETSTDTFTGFILNQGDGGPHNITYFISSPMGASASDTLLSVNGATITNSTFYDGKKIVAKTGTQAFSFENNTLTGATPSMASPSLISISSGQSNSIKKNNLSLTTTTTTSMSAIEIAGTSTRATVEYNTFTYNAAVNGGTARFLYSSGGNSSTIRYNNVNIIQTVSPSYTHIVNISNSTNDIYHNILIGTMADASDTFAHYYNQGTGNISGDETNYTGAMATCGVGVFKQSCGTGKFYCTDQAADIFDCGDTLYSTTAGVSGCVGHLCNGTEN